MKACCALQNFLRDHNEDNNITADTNNAQVRNCKYCRKTKTETSTFDTEEILKRLTVAAETRYCLYANF